MVFLILSGILLLVAAVAAVAIPLFLRIVVPTNMVHIVQSKKTTIAYGKDRKDGNVYYAWPSWIPFVGVTVIELQESIFQVSLRDYEAYDTARLPFMVDITAFFRIEKSESAAQMVSSFRELQEHLTNVLQGSVRRILATNTLEEIMEARSSLGNQFTEEVRLQLDQWGVIPVKTIEFMDLRDVDGSNVIKNIMAKEKSRIDKESRIAIAENQKEAESREIDAKRVVKVQEQDALQQIGLRTAEKDKAVGIADEKVKQEVQTQAKVTAEKNMEVIRVQEVRKAEIVREIAEVKAAQDKNVAVINANADKESTVLNAAGQMEAAKFEAEGIKTVGEAKATAERLMLQAPVDTQISLAREIGNNEGYQNYLVTIRQIEMNGEVGVAMAKSLEAADLKVIANSGDIQTGITSLGSILSPSGGTKLAGMLSALSQTDEGKALLEKVTGPVQSEKKDPMPKIKPPKI